MPQTNTTATTQNTISQELLQLLQDNKIDDFKIRLSNLSDTEKENVKSEFYDVQENIKKTLFVSVICNKTINQNNKSMILQSMIDNKQVGEWGVTLPDGYKFSPFFAILKENIPFDDKKPLLQSMIDNKQVGEWEIALPDGQKLNPFAILLKDKRLTVQQKADIIENIFPVKINNKKKYHLTPFGLGMVAGMKPSDLTGFNQNNTNIVAIISDSSTVRAEQDGDNLILPKEITHLLVSSDNAYVFQHTPVFQEVLKNNLPRTLALKDLIKETFPDDLSDKILDFNIGIQNAKPYNQDVINNYIEKSSKDIEQAYKNIFIKPRLEQVSKHYVDSLPPEHQKSARDEMPNAVQKITNGLFNALKDKGLKETLMAGRNYEKLPILKAARDNKFAPIPTIKQAVSEFKKIMQPEQENTRPIKKRRLFLASNPVSSL